MLGVVTGKQGIRLPTVGRPISVQLRNSLYRFIFFAMIATAIIAPVASTTQIPNIADYLTNLAILIQAKMALLNGQFPLRVMPLEHDGWNYPLYQFYSPTTFTIAGAIYAWLTPSNPLAAFQITLWAALVGGGVYLYRCAFWLVQSEPAALLAGVIYLCSPYYIIIINHLGSLNEVVGLGILPAVLYYTLQIYTSPKRKNFFIKLSIAWYMLATTHLVTFVYTSVFISLLLVVMTIRNPHRWRSLGMLSGAYGFAALLAMWYLAPIALLEKYFVLSSTYTHSQHVMATHPLLSQLLSPAATLTNNVKTSAMQTIHPSLGWPLILAVILSCYGYISRQTSGSRRADYWLPALLIVFFTILVFVWSPIDVWRWVPTVLLVAQYSWRLLSQTLWVGALLAGWTLSWLFNNKLHQQHVIMGTLFILISVNAWFPPSENASLSMAEFIRAPYIFYNNDVYLLNYLKYPQFIHRFDPTTANGNTITLAETLHSSSTTAHNLFQETIPPIPGAAYHVPALAILMLDPKTTNTISQTKERCHSHQSVMTCDIPTAANAKWLELPSLYYPKLLRVTLNNKVITYQGTLSQSLLLTGIVPVPGMNNHITIEFRGLPWANQISWGAWIIVLLVLLRHYFTKLKYWTKRFQTLRQVND